MNQRWTIVIVGVCVVMTCISIASAFYMYRHVTRVKSSIHSSDAVSEEVAQLVQSIDMVMELPTNETPSLATVTDVSKLQSNPFFMHASNGDKVLIYRSSAKAILYRPSTKKIIEVSVFTQQTAPTLTDTSASKNDEKIVLTILNGTTITGATTAYKKEVQAIGSDIRIGAVEMAKRRDYTDTMIIDISKAHSARIAELAKLLDIAVADLPKGETATGSDMLIILGTDKVK